MEGLNEIFFMLSTIITILDLRDYTAFYMTVCAEVNKLIVSLTISAIV